MSDYPKEGSELLLVAFGRDGAPFQVFTLEDGAAHLYDFDWSERCQAVHWHCSGVGYDELYLEHPTMSFWVAPGWRVVNRQGPRLLNLPPAFATLKQVFDVGHEGYPLRCAELEDAA